MRLVLMIVACFVLAGCVSDDGPPVAIQDPPPGKAQVWFIRPSTMVGAGNVQLVAINGTPVARLQVGQYTIVPVAPGPVVVTFRERVQVLPALAIRALQEIGGYSEVGRTRLAPGQSAFMRFPQFDWIGPGQASAIMGGMTYVPPLARP